MTCQYRLGEPEHPCGKPAVAVWVHYVTGEWPLCEDHDGNAIFRCALSDDLDREWHRRNDGVDDAA